MFKLRNIFCWNVVNVWVWKSDLKFLRDNFGLIIGFLVEVLKILFVICVWIKDCILLKLILLVEMGCLYCKRKY